MQAILVRTAEGIKPQIVVYRSPYSGLIGGSGDRPHMSNIYNFTNMLFHEELHVQRDFIKSIIFGQVQWSRRSFNDYNSHHAQIFRAQENHPSWNATTSGFKLRRNEHIKNLEH